MRFVLFGVLFAAPAFAQTAPGDLDWKAQLVKLAVGAGVAALSLLVGKALKSLSTWADAKGEESKVAKILAILPHLVEAVYSDVHAAVVGDIEAAAADGQLTAEELEHIRDVTVQALKDSLKKHGLETLKNAFGPALDVVLGKVVGEAQNKALASVKAPASPK